MAHGQNAQKHHHKYTEARRPGNLPYSDTPPDKRRTHRTERLQGERELHRELMQREPNVREEGLQWARLTYWGATLFDPECEEQRDWLEYEYMQDPLYDLLVLMDEYGDMMLGCDDKHPISPWTPQDEDTRTMYSCNEYQSPYRHEGYD